MSEEKVLLVGDNLTNLQIDTCFTRTASRKDLIGKGNATKLSGCVENLLKTATMISARV